jgi:membrane protease subunit HflC
MKNMIRVLAGIAVLMILLPFFVFRIDEREMAVVLRFGAPRHEYREPGIHFRWPLIDTVERVPKTQQFWGDSRDQLLPDLPTKDDKKIELIPWAIWRIKDPTVFVQRLRSMGNAEQRVAQITRSAIRDVITQYSLEDLVRSTDRELQITGITPGTFGAASSTRAEQILLPDAQIQTPKEQVEGRPRILERIKLEAQRRLAAKGEDVDAAGRGIELIDVGISQIAFVDSVRAKTFERWIAEREAISARNVNEGERLKAAIINETKAEVERIEGEGQQRSSEIRGRADAEVISKYGAAVRETGDFYQFVRTLEAYENAFDNNSRMVLTTDSPFFELFNGLPAITAEPTATKPPLAERQP